MRLLTFTIVLILLATSQYVGSASAQTPPPLSFASWRAQQINTARNQSVRIINRITMIKRSTGNISEIKRLETALRVADQNIDLAQDLTVEDYFNFYLSKYADRDAALESAAAAMTKNQLAVLLKSLLKSKLRTASVDTPSNKMLNWTRYQSL